MKRGLSVGGFFQQVRIAGARAAGVALGELDEGFVQAAIPNPSQESAGGADGGYLVPPDIRAEVVRLVLGDTSLLGRTLLVPTDRNSVTLPADVAPPWATTGVLPTIEGEGQSLAASKFAVQGRTVKLFKVQALVPVSDELVEDATALGAYLRAVAPTRLQFKVDDLIVNGDGNGKPLGLMNSSGKIVQTKEGGQTAGTIVLLNTVRMLTRLPSSARPNAVWIAHPETEPQLSALGLPHWNPSGPVPLLHGLPVLFREVAAPLGTEGDLALVDLASYFAAIRTPEVREDVSIHCWFDFNVSGYRFTMRVGGLPMWSSTVTRYRTSTTIGPFITLENR